MPPAADKRYNYTAIELVHHGYISNERSSPDVVNLPPLQALVVAIGQC